MSGFQALLLFMVCVTKGPYDHLPHLVCFYKLHLRFSVVLRSADIFIS